MAYSQTDFQVTHLLQRLFRRLKTAKVSRATGGSTTTIVDTKLLDLLGDSNEDDYLNNWTVIVTRDAGGAGAAPEGQFNRISDYDDGGTITVPDALTAAVASGDTYMYATPEFPFYDMIEVMNDALPSLGNVLAYDTSITTANNQTEYTLPLKLKAQKLLNVEIQGITTDANDNRWIPIPKHRRILAAAGSTGTLILPQYPSGYTVRITYLGLHPRVNVYDDYISESIHPELAVAVCTAYALQWYNTQTNGNNRYMLQREDRAWNQLDIAKSTYPVVLEPEKVQGFRAWMGETHDPEEFYPIPLP